MWIAKGTLLGTWLFVFGTIAYLYFAVFRTLPSGAAVDLRVITHYTTQNPLWWAAFVASIVLGCSIVGSWPGKGLPPVFWIAVWVTELVPVGLFVAIVVKLKQAMRGL